MMNLRLLLVLFCLALLPGSARAQQPTDPDALASAAYRAGDLSTARILWSELLQETRETSDDNQRARLCYNLGNVALREDRPMQAVGWYSASLRLRPRDGDTWSNLELARQSAGLDAADRGDLKATLDRLLTSWTVAESSWLALFASLPLLLAMGFEALRGGRAARWLIAGALCLAALGSAPWLWHQAQSGANSVMVVARESARARSEPRSDAPRVLDLEPGEVLTRSDTSPGWTELEAPGGSRGWLRNEDVFALNR